MQNGSPAAPPSANEVHPPYHQTIPPANQELERQRYNQERNLNHRLNQTEHLRQAAEQNGNLHLSETAGRMEANAQQRYANQIQQMHSVPSQYGYHQQRQIGNGESPPYAPQEAAEKPSFFQKVKGFFRFRSKRNVWQ